MADDADEADEEGSRAGERIERVRSSKTPAARPPSGERGFPSPPRPVRRDRVARASRPATPSAFDSGPTGGSETSDRVATAPRTSTVRELISSSGNRMRVEPRAICSALAVRRRADPPRRALPATARSPLDTTPRAGPRALAQVKTFACRFHGARVPAVLVGRPPLPVQPDCHRLDDELPRLAAQQQCPVGRTGVVRPRVEVAGAVVVAVPARTVTPDLEPGRTRPRTTAAPCSPRWWTS